MDLSEDVHDLALDTTIGDREMTLHLSAVETDGGLLLFDTGLADTIDDLKARLDGAGFDLEAVSKVLITHQDPDHAGGLSGVLDETDAMAVAHERDAPVIDGRSDLPNSDGERYPPGRIDLELGGEATFDTRAGPARVIETPGHTTGHVSVYFPEEGLLLAADALTADENGLAGPNPDATADMDEALSSVERLGDLDIDRILCYHGGFVAAGDDRIAEIAAESN